MVLDAELGLAVKAKSQTDRLESAGEVFHDRTRQFFLELARRDPDRYLVLDARHGTRSQLGWSLGRSAPRAGQSVRSIGKLSWTAVPRSPLDS